MSVLIAIAVVSILASFLCSILEATLLSLTPSYVAHQKQENPKLHAQLSALKNEIDQPIAAILTLNTIAHTTGALGVGAQVTALYGNAYVGLASVVMTLLILFLSEILPKTLGVKYWRFFAPYIPSILNFMIWSMKPLIWVSNLMMKYIGGSAHSSDTDMRLEIKALTQLGQETGELDDDETRVISNILDLHLIRVRDVMTPRTVTEAINPNRTIAEFIEFSNQEQFSRYPVIDEDEAPLGVIFRTDVIGVDETKLVSDLMHPVVVVTEQMTVEAVMALLMRERQHMAVVYDEYGTWHGVVTMEDIFETIIGKPILDETDDIPNMRRYARKLWESRQRNNKQPVGQ